MVAKVRKLGAAPEWLVPYIKETTFFWLFDTCYEYAVIDTAAFRKEYPSAPAMFAMNQNGFLAVSDSVEAQDRALAIYHEVVEFEGKLDENACLRALDRELSVAKYLGFYSASIVSYMRRRHEFFSAVAGYYEAMEKRTAEQDALLQRLYHSKAYLAAAIETLPAASSS